MEKEHDNVKLLNLRINAELFDEIHAYHKNTGRSKRHIAEHAFREYLDNHPQLFGGTK